jgi:hypothetical protein
MGAQDLVGSDAAGVVRTTMGRKDDWLAKKDPTDRMRQGHVWAGT